MVDENETQVDVTPAVVFENISVGVDLLERAFEAIGPGGTEAEFYRVLGRVVPAGTTRTKSINGHGFEQARSGRRTRMCQGGSVLCAQYQKKK
jgi:hypothetical protein